jgi:hypothetical protein
MKTKTLCPEIKDQLLATHIVNNENFTAACTVGDGAKIMAIVESEMLKHNLFTKGSEKLKADIWRMLQGKTTVPVSVGTRILEFVWNSQAKGCGLGVK